MSRESAKDNAEITLPSSSSSSSSKSSLPETQKLGNDLSKKQSLKNNEVTELARNEGVQAIGNAVTGKLCDAVTESECHVPQEMTQSLREETDDKVIANVSETVEASTSIVTEIFDHSTFRSNPLGIDPNTSFPRQITNPFLSNGVAKRSDWLNGTTCSSSFDNNVVSSVEGETVLIVENLNLTSMSQKKNDEKFPGILGNSKSTEPHMETDIDAYTDWSGMVGKKIRKKFGRKFFDGDVVEYDSNKHLFKVVYEDGDEEEIDEKEVKRLLIVSDDENDGLEDQPYETKRHRRHGSVSNNFKRSTKLGKRDTDHEASEEHFQERKFRGLRKSLVIDTSNDDSDVQPSPSSDRTSNDNKERRTLRRSSSSRKPRRRTRGKKTKTDDMSDSEKELSGIHTRLSSRYKEDSESIIEEAPYEHQIFTRKSANVHMITPDVITSPKLKDSRRQDDHTSELPSPPGGGMKLIGRNTQKEFGGEFYIGEIIDYDNRAQYYKVRYEDGDEEELDWVELEATLLPEEEHQQNLGLEGSLQPETEQLRRRSKDHYRRTATPKSKQGTIVLYGTNGDFPTSARRWRRKIRMASFSDVMKGGVYNWDASSPTSDSYPPPRPLTVARFASASDADAFEYFGWGEIVNFERSKCPELQATRLLPTSSPIVHLAASRHHLAALTAAGQVWIWRFKHGNIHTRCNKWEHISILDDKSIILVDISGPDVDRASAGYEAEQDDQAPDPFYLAAVCSTGEDIILQGSQPHEPVHTCQDECEVEYPKSLREAYFESNPDSSEYVGNIVQVSVGTVEAADESPFIGYITDTDSVYIRSATRDYMEEVNLVTGYTGKPIKIQCGRVYHAIIMTDDGRAWTWGQGYYPGSNVMSAGSTNKWSSPFSLCEPAVGTLVGRKVIDVGCYGEDFIALTNDGEVHQWTHARPNPASGVYNVPATPVDGQGPNITSGDKLKQVAIGAGVCAGISETGRVHTWRTAMKGGFVGSVGSEQEASTPLAHEEGCKETLILSLATRLATRTVCVAGSLLVVVKRKTRGRRGWKKRLLKGEGVHDETITG